ncbi:hypothetical protein K2173_009906 [Erythroxylum novogranatense]|uniref:Uncharacterized protein n=1 Tax=Erythroxylum novogranatense TaxID=1862640 RepID=A0AAV8SZ96_9ROSI|nr:hypothetical protein K2173_009906 [Erythroxylum novogranatense]
MEEKKRLAVVTLLMTLCLGMLLVSEETACTPDGGGSACKDCIVEQMKFSCPKCVPILQCMGRCLWGGSSRSRCSNIAFDCCL